MEVIDGGFNTEEGKVSRLNAKWEELYALIEQVAEDGIIVAIDDAVVTDETLMYVWKQL